MFGAVETALASAPEGSMRRSADRKYVVDGATEYVYDHVIVEAPEL